MRGGTLKPSYPSNIVTASYMHSHRRVTARKGWKGRKGLQLCVHVRASRAREPFRPFHLSAFSVAVGRPANCAATNRGRRPAMTDTTGYYDEMRSA